MHEYTFLCRLMVIVFIYVIFSGVFVFINYYLIKNKTHNSIIDKYQKCVSIIMTIGFIVLCVLLVLFNIKKVIP